MGDQSFRALVYSIAVHVLLAWLILTKLPHYETTPITHPIEFTVLDKSHKGRSMVTETDLNPDNDLDKLKKEADYLSQFTKRVKEQVVAKNLGRTKNRPGQIPVESDEQRSKGALGAAADAKNSRELALPGQGPGPAAGKEAGSSPFGRQVVVGSSTVGEFIPGIKEGAFTALNTDRYAFYTFFARINEQVRSRWIRNLRAFTESLTEKELSKFAGRDWITEVDIQLDREGDVVRALIMRSSGSSDLDQAAILAFQDAAPFANPPRELVEEDGLIHLRYGILVR